MALLISVLNEPDKIKGFTDQQWDELTCQARESNCLGRLYFLFKKHDVLTHIPAYVLWHYTAPTTVAERLKKNALREVEGLSNALKAHDIKATFLKGAAYQICDLNANEGRFMSDIDILVDKEKLDQTQSLLLQHGWLSSPMDDYDQKYYREWMHEIPPLRHIERQTILDVHHNILPLTNKNSPIATQLETRKVFHYWCGEVQVLTEADTVIHSAVHLFTESEFHHALRDLSDLNMLIREFSENNSCFIEQLINRANTLGLSSYAWLALTFTRQIFLLNVSNKQLSSLHDAPISKITINFFTFCYSHVFLPNHSSCRTWKMSLASELLFWRSHLIKMPLSILIPHLIKKSYKRFKENFNQPKTPSQLP